MKRIANRMINCFQCLFLLIGIWGSQVKSNVLNSPNRIYSLNVNELQVIVGDLTNKYSVKSHEIYFDYGTSLLVVNDVECSDKLQKCKNYCKDNTLNKIFCPQICKKLNQKNYDAYCPSTLKENIGGQQIEDFQINEEIQTRFIGRNAHDQLIFSQSNGKDSNGKFFMDTKDVRFLRGVSIDHQLAFPTHNISIGLVPGPNNLFIQLYQQNLIHRPQISFSPTKNGSKRLTIGTIKNEECGNWVFQPLINNTQSLMLNVQSIRIFEQEFDNLKILIDNNNYDGIVLPFQIHKKLIDKEVLFLNEDVNKNFYLIKRHQVPQMSFQLDNNVYNFDPSMLFQKCYNQTYSISSIEILDEENKDSDLMILGRKFSDLTCHGINYEKNWMYFGEKTWKDESDAFKCEINDEL